MQTPRKPPDAPIADAVVLVDVPRTRGVEDPAIVAELRELSRSLALPPDMLRPAEHPSFGAALVARKLWMALIKGR